MSFRTAARSLLLPALATAFVLQSAAPVEAKRFSYQRDGRCDDPRYEVTTGRGRPGTDEHDCKRHGFGLSRWHEDDDGIFGGDTGEALRAAALVLGGLALLGMLMGSGDDGVPAEPTGGGTVWSPTAVMPGGNIIVWNDGPAVATGLRGLGRCRETVRSGIHERYGLADVTFSGGPEQGRAVSGSRVFNYACDGGRIHVWE